MLTIIGQAENKYRQHNYFSLRFIHCAVHALFHSLFSTFTFSGRHPLTNFACKRKQATTVYDIPRVFHASHICTVLLYVWYLINMHHHIYKILRVTHFFNFRMVDSRFSLAEISLQKNTVFLIHKFCK
jgi:hypothetical protein